jgi:putative toxin-antitoxin system antitoxin component (TIGR02293 family)
MEHMARILEIVPEPDFNALPPSVMAHALDTFGEEKKAKSWLTTPNPVLDNQEPLQLARTADGARRVEEVLTRIDYGMFS